MVDCPANAVTILRNDPAWAGVLAWDELSQAIVCRKAAQWFPDDAPGDPDPKRPWSDTDGMRVQNYLQRRWGLSVSESVAYKAAYVVAEAQPFDPLLDWIGSLSWDGKPRVANWLSTYLGAVDSEYSRFVGQAFLVGSVARALAPGCKMDTMLVLEGKQGLFKSQAVQRLFGAAWFRETPIDLRSNDRFLSVRGCWCREWPELDGFGKADATRIKSFLSAAYDDFRAPYGRTMQHAPRRCVFIATVNPPDLGYLIDESGNRRMWPIECGASGGIELDAISRDAAQLWAEARELHAAGAKWWPVTADERRLCNQEQDARMTAEVWEGKIARWLNEGTRMGDVEVTIPQILGECLSIPAERWDRANSARVGACLGRAGWAVVGRESAASDGRGKRERIYRRRPPEPAPADEDIEREALVADSAGAG